MTMTNIKFRPGTKEAPTEPFKRAVTGCLRAIACTPELEVNFAAERPGLAPGKARLPEPARKMTKRDAAIVRGHADSMALKLACHDPKVHRKLMPGNPQARGVFEAVEQARVEAIGARRMSGVARNLTAMLDDHFHRGKYDEITERADAPLSDALAMMVRERLTGLAPPNAAKKMVDLWRPILEDKIGTRLDKLSRFTEDQAKFGDMVHDLLSALDLGDERNTETDEDDNQDDNADGENDQSGAEGSPDSDAAQEMSADQADATTEEMSDSAMESAQASTSDTFDDGELGDDETPGEATRPNMRGSNEPRGPEYHAFAPKFDEVIAAEDLDLDAAALQGARQDVGAGRRHRDRAAAHRAGIVEQQRHHGVAEGGVFFALEGQGMQWIDDDPGQPRGIQHALLEIELPGATLLRHQPALQPVCQPRDHALEMGKLFVQITPQAVEFLGLAQILGRDGFVELGRERAIIGSTEFVAAMMRRAPRLGRALRVAPFGVL